MTISFSKKKQARLDQLLNDLPVLDWDNPPLSLSMLDGYLTCVLVSPMMIVPSLWLPGVWGSEEFDFESEAQARDVMGAIMDHYNAIARTLAAGRKIKPIFEEDPNSGETLWEPWIAGFERAMRLDPDGWEEVVQSEDEEASASLLFFLALYEVDQGTSKLEEDAIAEIDATAPDIIPNCVASLHSLSVANRSPVGSTPFPGEGLAAVASHSKPGRNDPCYCGSGRKYKKCCGSN